MDRNKKNLLRIVLLVIIASFISFILGGIIFYNWGQINQKFEITFDPEKVDIQNIHKFNQIRDILKTQYYKDVDENTMLEGAIAGMTDSLSDPYTVYFDKEQMQLFMEKSEGSYCGIGISITVDNNGLLSVVELFGESPAKKAGMLQGDKIIKVNNKDVTGIKDESIVIKMIRGDENTKVKVTVYRQSEGKAINFDLTRQRIKINNISSEFLSDKIGYIRIIMFDNEITETFNMHLEQMLKMGMKGLIIDVRDNPGGSYDQVVSVADRLIPKGLIVYIENKYKKKIKEYSDEMELKIPMVVLINNNSASASEILAGAIKDHKKGTLVGTGTFGKGLVQEVKQLGDGSGIKVTIARYFTPSGVCIQGVGIQPDIKIDSSEKYKNIPVSQIPKREDIQLNKAIEILKWRIE